jgi:hypothetical protein
MQRNRKSRVPRRSAHSLPTHSTTLNPKFAVAALATFALVSTAHADRCTPPGIGNSLMTWTRPKDCPLSKDEATTKRWCKTLPPGDRPRVCWGQPYLCVRGLRTSGEPPRGPSCRRSRDASRRWLHGGWRWLLLRSAACQRLSTFSINSRNSAILAARFATSRVRETAGGRCRLRPTLVLSTSLCRCVIVCNPPIIA